MIKALSECFLHTNYKRLCCYTRKRSSCTPYSRFDYDGTLHPALVSWLESARVVSVSQSPNRLAPYVSAYRTVPKSEYGISHILNGDRGSSIKLNCKLCHALVASFCIVSVLAIQNDSKSWITQLPYVGDLYVR